MRLRLLFVLLFVFAPELRGDIPLTEFAARRDSVATVFGDGVLVVYGALAPEPDYLPWQQSRAMLYLTGFREPDAVLVLDARGGTRRWLLFVQPRDPAVELWSGTRIGPAGVRSAFGVEGRPLPSLNAFLDSILPTADALGVAGDFVGPRNFPTPHQMLVTQLVGRHPGFTPRDQTVLLESLRSRKSEAELDRIRIASEISARGHVAAMRLAVPGMMEFELAAEAEHVFRREGADGPAYASIVGGGPRATILHTTSNRGVVEPSELVLMDMGASFDGYAADITRTIPISGRFSPTQRDIYNIVLAALEAAEQRVRAGAPAQAMTDAAVAVLAEGLTRLGLIDSPNASYDCGNAARPRTCSQLSIFYPHGLGHGIGLDVHDPDQFYQTGKLDVGSAFTIEPGIYVRPQLQDVILDTPANRAYLQRIAQAYARYESIGVRIEDNYLITADGVERVSAGVPRGLEEIERILAEPRTPRDPAIVRRFLEYQRESSVP